MDRRRPGNLECSWLQFLNFFKLKNSNFELNIDQNKKNSSPKKIQVEKKQKKFPSSKKIQIKKYQILNLTLSLYNIPKTKISKKKFSSSKKQTNKYQNINIKYTKNIIKKILHLEKFFKKNYFRT